MSFAKEFKAFGKAQASAFIGGAVDYGTMLICVELLGWHYVVGIIVGGIVGAVVNFLINRNWSFRGKKDGVDSQIPKYLLVLLGSIFFKSLGTSFFTEIVGIDYKISRIVTDLMVSLGWNYTLQRYWVFKRQM